MRKVLTAATLMLAVFLAGCNQEKAQVTEYLQALDASNTKMKTLAKEMESSMSGLQQEIAGGNFDAEAIKGKITGFQDKMRAEKEHIEGLQVPEKAKALHDVAVKQYQTAVDVLGETLPMIDIAKQMSEAAKKIKADPKKAKEVMAEMKEAQAKMMEIQGRVAELAKQGKEYEETAKAEQKKLQEEFGIQFKSEDSGAAGSSEGGDAAEGGEG